MLKGKEYGEKENKAAVAIQKNFRMKLVQKQMPEIKEEKEREKAALVIQKNIRVKLARKEAEKKREEQEKMRKKMMASGDVQQL